MKAKLFGFRIFLEQIENKGEDSNPILEHYGDLSGCIGVFDGMGGAGGATYDVDGGLKTGAYIASNYARKIVREFFSYLKPVKNDVSINAIASNLTLSLKTHFKTLAEKFDNGGTSSKLKSSLIKRFPTTMAVMYFNPVEKDLNEQPIYNCNTFWAGDSRCYLLTADNGLQQITEDDIKSGGDALDNLTNDSPISNCINADVDFSVKYHQLEISSPVIFIAATDGCFGFIPTPAHFEFLLLETLSASENSEQWVNNLNSEFKKIAGDDVSMSVVGIGWESFTDIKKDFAERLRFITTEYIEPVNSIDEEVKKFEEQIQKMSSSKEDLISKRNKLRSDLWLSYKKTYEIKKEKEINNEGRGSY
jgi:serine/threonine protein phosphatase PrpC